ncbi:helicase [Leptospira fletcheri]|uniref:Helicase n=1 Tax=Leptospira fletcheri TaxID=2484981 RepID=A0A4R9G593_9LEPT|nr:phospholipase D-like domain-containing anti-phage protein [Leptospira fletcheri]TGK06541.1 helicase [Leptospira fletcheri]
MSIKRFSSRRLRGEKQNLGESFLNEKLRHAVTYDRIAGYFSPSILEVAGESLESIQKSRMICNSHVSLQNIVDADGSLLDKSFKDQLWLEWCGEEIENQSIPPNRLERLYHFLETKKLEVKILPEERFGLIHGKAGVITYRDGSKTSFLGSANESIHGWKLNYELLWEDESEEGILWIQEEFDSLWNDPKSFYLTRDIIEDILRNSKRQIISKEEWKKDLDPASPIIESPVYRKQNGLWSHQKYFVNKVFEDHNKYGGARYVLADQVGLGKTLQLAMAAQLIALYGELPILIIAPKTLLLQWQMEFLDLLEVPSAIWNGNAWVDERNVEHPKFGPSGILKCPRKIGIISQGLINRNSESVKHLLHQKYECVILDEAHRARRKNIPAADNLDVSDVEDPNRLYRFLIELAPKTKTLLLATATPVQLHPIEAWDLLKVLNTGSEMVLGDRYSPWMNPSQALNAMFHPLKGINENEFWQWLRNPLPPAEETTEIGGRDFRAIRNSLSLADTAIAARQDDLEKLPPPDKAKLRDLRKTFFLNHNPFLRRIIQRQRKYLEEQIDPETKRPILDRVNVQLFGERDEDAILLNSTQQVAYDAAIEYCKLLRNKKKGSGFLETLILRRIGSSMLAGKLTAKKLLHGGLEDDPDLFFEQEDEDLIEEPALSEEADQLNIIINSLELDNQLDPKFLKIKELLIHGIENTGPWLERGCIIFSGYYSSAKWIAEQLSGFISEQVIGLYSGSNKSAILKAGNYIPVDREKIKKMVKNQEIKILVGTDAASEGLNLQSLGTLINLDLPWNPTKLEQRKGRIQRIGQRYNTVYIYNMRYKGSVEDTVHSALSERLEKIGDLFGQIPDTLEDVWVDVALGEIELAKSRIIQDYEKHPFELKYNNSASFHEQSWEKCFSVLNNAERLSTLSSGW